MRLGWTQAAAMETDCQRPFCPPCVIFEQGSNCTRAAHWTSPWIPRTSRSSLFPPMRSTMTMIRAHEAVLEGFGMSLEQGSQLQIDAYFFAWSVVEKPVAACTEPGSPTSDCPLWGFGLSGHCCTPSGLVSKSSP